MVFCFVRETKQLTLEELDRKLESRKNSSSLLPLTSLAEVFSVPTSKFISHELTVWLPYFIKRHILRKNIMKPPQLIQKESKVDAMLRE